MKEKNKTISEFFREVAKKTHKKKPRSKEFYKMMQAKSVAKRRAKKHLST